jgi:aryl-alcohol dehydrogenase-like predicted oxidoreductase
VHRMGLSGSYWPGKEAIHRAVDEGINVFFAYGFDRQMTRTLRELMRGRREDFVIATGPYNLIIGHTSIRRTLEKRLRQFQTDYIDAFLFLGVMKEKQFPQKARDELLQLKEEGLVRRVGMSCHDRVFAGRLAAEGDMDALMVRYNAAHPGAEQDVFPHLAEHDPAVISYTATRWGYLLRRPKGWEERIPDAGMCYRFVLDNDNVDVALTAPRNLAQLEENLAAVEKGPLSLEDIAFMRRFGEQVHHTKKWFM